MRMYLKTDDKISWKYRNIYMYNIYIYIYISAPKVIFVSPLKDKSLQFSFTELFSVEIFISL